MVSGESRTRDPGGFMWESHEENGENREETDDKNRRGEENTAEGERPTSSSGRLIERHRVLLEVKKRVER